MYQSLVISIVGLLLLGGTARMSHSADEDSAIEEVDAKKLVGVWEVESGPAALPKGITMTFTNDGNVRVGVAGVEVEAGTYELKGTIITIKPPQGKDGKGRIKELTDTKLVIKDDAEPKEIVLKRVKK